MTKPVPGARRGRPWPLKVEKPATPRGKPGRPSRVPLCQHPKRFEIAWVAALQSLAKSERGGARYLLWCDGRPTTSPDEKTVDRLRKLAASFATPDDLAWLTPIVEAILISLTIGETTPDAAIRQVLRRTALVGDTLQARHVLLPELFEIRRRQRQARRNCPN